MRILITGVHGFVGTNLVEYLMRPGSLYAPEHTVYGLDIVAPERAGVKRTFSWDDLGAGRVPEVDAVIHLAGVAHDTVDPSDTATYFAVNAGLTRQVFDYFCTHPGIRKFIFFSSVKAAADRVEGVLTEDVVPAPAGPYGESKLQAEEHIRASAVWRSAGAADPGADVPGKQVYILRPCMIHGPGNKGNLNLLYDVVRRGIPWPLGAFGNRRTFTSVENACFAVRGLLERDVPTGIYQLGDDESLSTNELIGVICGVLGKKAHIWRLPKGLMVLLARLGGLLHLPLDPERLRKLTENYVVSNARIKAALGVERMPVDARTGLWRTISSFR